MRRDQHQRADGKFNTTPVGPAGGRMAEEDRLVDRVEFRITNRDWRRLMILFQHHRQQFGWQIHSDMFRSLTLSGLIDFEKKVKNPTAAMEEMTRTHQELEKVAEGARRHTTLDMVLEQIENDIDVTVKAGDLGAVRTMLNDFKAHTKEIKHDPVIRARREMEFDKRWGRLYESLNRGASLTQFEDD